jgi:type II secretory pathway pseudopilin PulG
MNWDDYSLLTTLADGDTFLVHDVSETVVGQKMKRIAKSSLISQFKGTTVIGTTRYNQFYLAAGRDLKPMITGGCAASAQIEMGTNKNVYDCLAFDKTTEEYAYANFVMPGDYTGGDLYFVYHWTHPATTTNFGVFFYCRAVAITNNQSLDVAWGTATGTADTGGITSRLYTSSLSAALTCGGSPVANKWINLKINRYPTGAEDNLDVDAYLLGVMIWYPVA